MKKSERVWCGEMRSVQHLGCRSAPEIVKRKGRRRGNKKFCRRKNGISDDCMQRAMKAEEMTNASTELWMSIKTVKAEGHFLWQLLKTRTERHLSAISRNGKFDPPFRLYMHHLASLQLRLCAVFSSKASRNISNKAFSVALRKTVFLDHLLRNNRIHFESDGSSSCRK